jgi:hypothetical protein
MVPVFMRSTSTGVLIINIILILYSRAPVLYCASVLLRRYYEYCTITITALVVSELALRLLQRHLSRTVGLALWLSRRRVSASTYLCTVIQLFIIIILNENGSVTW